MADSVEINEDKFYHIGRYIAPESLLIYNNTRVIQARLLFHKSSTMERGVEIPGARIEVFCLEPLAPRDYQLSLSATDGETGIVWKCMIGNLKKWKSGRLALTLPAADETTSAEAVTLYAERLDTTGNTHSVRFTWTGDVSFAEILDAMGQLPIPPYLNRDTEESDKRTYQTVYSRIKGSVAAPTAGLHFTDKVLDGLREQGIKTTEVTLHVGAGTFQPVKTEDANEHVMHTEIIAVPRESIESIRRGLGRVVAVGTTSMRTLESLYFLGETVAREADGQNQEVLRVSQFEPYDRAHTLTTEEAMDALLQYLDRTGQDTLHAETQIMIKPGYTFHVVDQLITNFHQPKSTLLLLVSAFLGNNAEGEENWHSVYRYALDHDFRFLSYGDSSILTRRKD